MANVGIAVPAVTLKLSSEIALPIFVSSTLPLIVTAFKESKKLVKVLVESFTVSDVQSVYAFTGRQKEVGGSIYVSTVRSLRAPFYLPEN